MRILITGATGFIGSHIAEALVQKGYTVRAAIRPTSSKEWLKGVPVEYVSCDLLTGKDIDKAVEGVDYVYHVAGVTKARTKEGYFLGNQTATRKLLEVVAQVNPGLKRFIHMSSGAAVGPGSGETLTDETVPFHPITTYGISKMEAEKECLRFMDKLPISIVRPSVVYGPRDKDVFEFFSTMAKGLQPMVGFNKKLVSMVHSADLVRGTIVVGEHEKAVGQTYFINNEQPYTWPEIGEVTKRVMGRSAFSLRVPEAGIYTIAAFAELYSLISRQPALINFEKARDMVQQYWAFDAGKAKRELGFSTSLTLEEGIKDAVAWYRKQGWIA